MIIVGLTGSIGSGKTTFANYLSGGSGSASHWESWQLVAEVATALREGGGQHPDPADISAINTWLTPLPDILQKVCHKTISLEAITLTPGRLRDAPENYDKLLQYLQSMRDKPELQASDITEDTKEVFRSLLQWLGGYLAKTAGGDIWYAEIIRRIQSSPGLELATIGGVRFPADARCIKRAQGVIIKIVRPGLPVQDRQDLTERERESIAVDATVNNDSGLVQLQSCAQRVKADLRAGTLRSKYKTAAL